MNIQEVLLGSTPIVIGLVQLIKGTPLPSWTYPIFALLFGVGTVTLFASIGAPYAVFNAQVVVFGLIAGLSSIGLYAAGSSTSTTVVAALAKRNGSTAATPINTAQVVNTEVNTQG